MAQTHEERLLEYLLKESASAPEQEYPHKTTVEDDRNADLIAFSDAAQKSNTGVVEDAPLDFLQSKSNSETAERALIGALFNTRDFETRSTNLKHVEKVSHPTLSEQVISKLGRL